jgi:hypothetical protein
VEVEAIHRLCDARLAARAHGVRIGDWAMETGRVLTVWLDVGVLLAATRADGTGAAAPEGAVDGADVALLAAACAGCTGAVAPVDGELGDPGPGLGGAGVDWGVATGACTGTVPCTACGAGVIGVPACTKRALGIGVVRSAHRRGSPRRRKPWAWWTCRRKERRIRQKRHVEK